MSIIKLPQMSQNEIITAIKSNNLCRIAFLDEDYPYISPFQYVYIESILYFHLTDYGKKKEILEKNQNVCISIEKFEPDLSEYYFISMQGKLKLVKDIDLQKYVISQLEQQAKKRYSKNFLSAHGFDKNKEWTQFNAKNQLIYEFQSIKKPIGLKSLS